VGISRREALARLSIGAASFLACACKTDARPTVRQGLIIGMQAASFLRVASFTLRTDDGEVIDMACEGDVGITPGHMRDHMALAEPVAVTVKYDGDRVIALRVDDAPGSAASPPATPPRPEEPVKP
jgi:hypothetical protein